MTYNMRVNILFNIVIINLKYSINNKSIYY